LDITVLSFHLTFLLFGLNVIVYLFLLPFLPIEKRFNYDAEFKRKVILGAEQVWIHAALKNGTNGCGNCTSLAWYEKQMVFLQGKYVLKLMPLL